MRRKDDVRLAPMSVLIALVELVDEARRGDNHRRVAAIPSERAEVGARFALHLERLVIAFSKQFRLRSPQLEQLAGDEQLLAAVSPIFRKNGYRGAGDFVQQSPPSAPVDRPPIVGIDQAEIPQLAALVDVRYPRHGQLEDQLGQRRDRARPCQRLDKGVKPDPRIADSNCASDSRKAERNSGVSNTVAP